MFIACLGAPGVGYVLRGMPCVLFRLDAHRFLTGAALFAEYGYAYFARSLRRKCEGRRIFESSDASTGFRVRVVGLACGLLFGATCCGVGSVFVFVFISNISA
ncbi:MAG: hypothetical protein MI923_25290 [Phycisphaerales bacterium]|nr:hypothetical protein [Phycisphaerales bacterium]